MVLRVARLDIPDCLLIQADCFADGRGHFAETYNRTAFQRAGIEPEFVQDNQSLSASGGTIRGLHFQAPPFAQAKLIRVLRGAILDVAVDIRSGSPTFGRHVAVELDADPAKQVYIPEGFAHGFCTLEPDTEVFYKVSAPYAPAHNHGLLWRDPALAIDWPVKATDAILSSKDLENPVLDSLPPMFHYGQAASTS